MTNHIVPFSVIEQTIKRGVASDSPNVLYHYLDTSEAYAEQLGISESYNLYKRVYQVLLETVCDAAVPMHWRELCLNAINRPLLQLKRFVITDQDAVEYFRLEHELRALSHYFMAGMPFGVKQ
ncbi:MULTISPECIES: hypothetical protein [Marinomonas]|jgi:hypothetical protein|uniref:Uncharacterized protein n=2 Tax=Marinomonas TaxID=28253 RepID=A0A4R6X0S9_9GAMM|nr:MULTISPECIES: hypothetical protein [Marinomonas]MBJ7549921.1 hypothetical protein [Marinomonas ostreistagni]MCC4273306.1 hypothetical protein [Marinomonas communis]RUM50543.1 MAG: hypothetical protein DSY85_13495 [Marinomonas sp.]TDR12445.1 hypothetical protein C8D85_2479 [Marinomonas communis]|tara:strand:+ start:226 stop:594 length:369 start_codon:yes stop_codon:yes gene_type:complete